MHNYARPAGAWTLFCVIIACVAAFFFAGKAPLQTDLLALLPETESNPVAEKAIKALNAAAGNRAIYLVGHANEGQAKSAAVEFARTLLASEVFSGVRAQIPPFDIETVITPYREFRFALLSDSARQEISSGQFDLALKLYQRLNNPIRLSSNNIQQDPFGLLDDFVASLPYRNLKLEIEDGFLTVRDSTLPVPMTYILVIAELSGSAYDDHVQTATLAATEAASRNARYVVNDLKVLQTGSVFFAAAARDMAKREMHLITLISVCGIILLLLSVFRSLLPLGLCLLAVGAGLMFATTATLVIHGELHLLTLVFGASLIGEAVDYPIQYVAARAAAGASWNAREGLLKIRSGLTLALATSVLGYTTLMFIPFPAVKQIALFALTGLTGAYCTVLFLLPFLLQKPSRQNLSATATLAEKFTGWWRSRVNTRKACGIALAAVLLAAPGWYMAQTSDDVRVAVAHPESLLRQDAAVRDLTGLGNSFRFFLVEGPTIESVLQREETLVRQLQMLVAAKKIDHYQAVSSFVPSAKRQTENRSLLSSALFADQAKLNSTLNQAGFPEKTAVLLRNEFDSAETRVMGIESWLTSSASGPYRHLWMGQTGRGYASLVVPFGEKLPQHLDSVTADLPGVTLVDKAGSVSRLFRDYRTGFSIGLAAALLAVLFLLSRRYGWRQACIVLIPTILGLATAVSVSGYAGVPITLFSVMGLMLVMGVGVNYTIFLVEGGDREGPTLVAVLVSAGTTLLSFGLLSLSGMAALAQFGLILLIGVGSGVLFTPLVLTFSRR